MPIISDSVDIKGNAPIRGMFFIPFYRGNHNVRYNIPFVFNDTTFFYFYPIFEIRPVQNCSLRFPSRIPFVQGQKAFQTLPFSH